MLSGIERRGWPWVTHYKRRNGICSRLEVYHCHHCWPSLSWHILKPELGMIGSCFLPTATAWAAIPSVMNLSWVMREGIKCHGSHTREASTAPKTRCWLEGIQLHYAKLILPYATSWLASCLWGVGLPIRPLLLLAEWHLTFHYSTIDIWWRKPDKILAWPNFNGSPQYLRKL